MDYPIVEFPSNTSPSQTDEPVQVNQPEKSSKILWLIPLIILYVISVLVFAYGAYLYGKNQGEISFQALKKLFIGQPSQIQPTQTPREAIISIPEPTVNVSPGVSLTGKAAGKITPTIVSKTSPTPGIPNYKYTLPGGWQTVQATDASFEMGFDPNKYITDVGDTPGSIFIKPKDGGTYTSLTTLKAYNGGSKYTFIFGSQPVTKGDTPDKYKETVFSYESKSCLFLENVVISAGPTVYGMCDVGNGKAFWVNTWDKNYLPIVRTLKVLR